jgi:hypothetical protein
VRTSLTVTPGSPEPVQLSSTESLSGGVAVLVYRSTGSKLFAVDPGNPSQTITLDFSSGKLAPVALTGVPGTYKYMFATGFTLLGAAAELQAQWPAVADGTIGNNVFPTYKPLVAWGIGAADLTDAKDPVYVFDRADSVTLWADCGTCVGFARPGTVLPPGTSRVAGMDVYYRATAGQGVWSALGSAQTYASSRSTPGTSEIGIAMGSPNASSPTNSNWIGSS